MCTILGGGLMPLASMGMHTPKGQVFIEGPMEASELENLNMNQGLNNFRPPKKQKQAIINIVKSPQSMVYIVRHNQEIIGYVTFHPMDSFTRWHKHPKIIEMGCIEISPAWRNCKLGENLMAQAFQDKMLDNYIVITMEYCWHWDLKNSKLNIWEYQKMLTHLFAKVGFKKVNTNDPEIMEHPANVLMARIGKDVSPEDINLFESLMFC